MKRQVMLPVVLTLLLGGVSALNSEWIDCSLALQGDMGHPSGGFCSMGLSVGYSQYLGYVGYSSYTDLLYAPLGEGEPMIVNEAAGLATQFQLSSHASIFASVGPALEVSVVDHDESSATRTDSIFQFGLGAVLGARATLSSDIGVVFGLKGSWYFVSEAEDKDTEKNAFSVAGFAGVTLGIGPSYDPAPGSLSPYYHY